MRSTGKHVVADGTCRNDLGAQPRPKIVQTAQVTAKVGLCSKAGLEPTHEVGFAGVKGGKGSADVGRVRSLSNRALRGYRGGIVVVDVVVVSSSRADGSGIL